MDDTTPQLVPLRPLAKRLCLTTTWLKAEAEAGRLPHLRAGRRVLFNVDAVQQHLLHRAAKGVPRD